MRYFLLFCILFLAACSHTFIKTQPPESPLDMQGAATASGVIEPQQFYFTMITRYQTDRVRVLILAEPAIKLADMTVYKDKAELYYKAPKVPQKLLKIWVLMIRENFFAACPQRHIVYKQGNKIIAQADVAGGICR